MHDAARKIAASAFCVLRRSHARLEFDALWAIAYRELARELDNWPPHSFGAGWVAIVSKAVRNRTISRYKHEELLLYKAWKPNPVTNTRTWRRFLGAIPPGFDRPAPVPHHHPARVRPLIVGLEPELEQLLARGLTPSQISRSLGLPLRTITRALKAFRDDQRQLSWNADLHLHHVG